MYIYTYMYMYIYTYIYIYACEYRTYSRDFTECLYASVMGYWCHIYINTIIEIYIYIFIYVYIHIYTYM